MKRTSSAWSRLGLGLLVLTALAAACGSDAGSDEAVETDDPVEANESSTSSSTSSGAETSETATTDDPTTTTSSTTESTAAETTTTSAPEPDEPTTTERGQLTDVRPVPITSITNVGPRTIDVVVEGGIEPCFIIDRVDVVETETRVELTVNAGSEPGAVCIEIVELHTATVELADPIGDRTVVDGATGRPI